ncbi:hypothetical protein AB5I41_29580 [Sphingomonas sp. MMS24-JH45]
MSGGSAPTAANPTIGAPGQPGTNSPLVCDISGQWLPGISKWAFSYGGEYNLPTQVFGKDGEAYVR